ncbi:hypothetical protein OPT61_g6512 [Boeremia exigua]|uniref:Uncharacterized protein n=1 Tax=Boeremia exigua TaxID=749465 RepID=A0ACC2I6C0_9PLEO|nr:hypothetical protein OPT61_g6512 [Boeremia exigua]
MAGGRANLAVTKDGETYNKLQRPDDFLDDSGAANGRKRERAVIDRPTAGPTSGNKRTKTHHDGSTANSISSSDDRHHYGSAAAIAECGMRFTLPIDDEEAYGSDDSLGEALAYLRSVRSEASAIPNLLVTSTIRSENANTTLPKSSKTSAGQRTFYQDGAWVSVDEGYKAAHNADELDDEDPQGLYYKKLVKHFKSIRNTLNAHGTHKIVEPVTDASQSLPAKPPSNRHEWLYTLDREYPTPPQVCQLDEKAVRRGLEYCAYAMDRFDTISRQKSCWTWTLLALSGDIGTLDSQKMGHIRDLGNKAAEMSTALHGNPEYQNQEVEHHHPHANLVDAGQDGGSEADKPISYDADGDSPNSGMGYVRPDANEDLSMTDGTPLNKSVPEHQGEVQPDAVETSKGTDIDTNDNDVLEEARARLLAQLGDNLVQTGIPSIDETQPCHGEQSDNGSNPLQHEIKIRAIPSRAEAERQRQMMRVQHSVTASSREPDARRAEPAVALHFANDHGSTIVDTNTRVTIDMILTIVAECYGQRDLLKFRKPCKIIHLAAPVRPLQARRIYSIQSSIGPIDDDMGKDDKSKNFNLKVPKGTRDWTGEDAALRDRLFETVTTVFKRHGATTLDTPVFELKEILSGKYGEDSKLIYDLQDQGGELCSLRYDLTVPLARWLAMNPSVQSFKRYQIAKVYRRDQPAMTKGRMREFYQCDFDIAGAYDAMIPDAEVLKIVNDVFKALGWESYTIKMNHRKILDGMFKAAGVKEELIRPISSAVDKLDKLPWAEVKQEMETKGLPADVADKIGEWVQRKGGNDIIEFLKADPVLSQNEDVKKGIQDMELLFAYLDAFDARSHVSFDLSLARGLDYYTGLIYEVVTEGSAPSGDGKKQEIGVGSVAAGGRYDNLVGMFSGKPIPCVGISFGIDRIISILKARGEATQRAKDVDVFVMAFGGKGFTGMLTERMQVAQELWASDIKTEFSYKLKPKLPQQFKQAESAGVPLAVILGEEELKAGKIKIKIMGITDESNPEKDGVLVDRKDMATEIRKRLPNANAA